MRSRGGSAVTTAQVRGGLSDDAHDRTHDGALAPAGRPGGLLLALVLVAPVDTDGDVGKHIKQGVLITRTATGDAGQYGLAAGDAGPDSPAAAGRGWDLSSGKGA
jgi:hypothetical protein